jgi:hypothetical protein
VNQRSSNYLNARIVVDNGMPVLTINGSPTRPLIFFFNTEVEGDCSAGDGHRWPVSARSIHMSDGGCQWAKCVNGDTVL